mgnify:CR=1 FL=1
MKWENESSHSWELLSFVRPYVHFSYFKRGILQAKSIYPPMMGRTTEVAAVEETMFENMRVADAAQSMKGFG